MTELYRLGLQLLAILVVLGGASAVLVRLQRRKAAQQDGQLALLARMPLEGRRVVYLVRAGRRVLVVGGSEAGLTRLADFDGAELALQEVRTIAKLDELEADASAAELLRVSESPIPPRSTWRRSPESEAIEEDFEAADFPETTGSRRLSTRTEATSSRSRATETDTTD
jgi:flagellar biogenesis protein FliO